MPSEAMINRKLDQDALHQTESLICISKTRTSALQLPILNFWVDTNRRNPDCYILNCWPPLEKQHRDQSDEDDNHDN